MKNGRLGGLTGARSNLKDDDCRHGLADLLEKNVRVELDCKWHFPVAKTVEDLILKGEYEVGERDMRQGDGQPPYH